MRRGDTARLGTGLGLEGVRDAGTEELQQCPAVHLRRIGEHQPCAAQTSHGIAHLALAQSSRCRQRGVRCIRRQQQLERDRKFLGLEGRHVSKGPGRQ